MDIERQTMEVDIACVGFGPAMGGFLATLNAALSDENRAPALQSRAMPGMPLQVVCYERADDAAFGVSGVITKAKNIRQSFPKLDVESIPMATPIKREKLVYLMDPLGASRRSPALRFADRLLLKLKSFLPLSDSALEIPWIPPFLAKHGGLLLSIGQFNQWVSSHLMASGSVQIWPGMPVDKPMLEDNSVVGIQLVDQGVDKTGAPDELYMPGMNIRAALTVVGDGPVGSVGQALDRHFGLPAGHHQRDWAVGMKMLVELPEDSSLEAGTAIHTFGFPEPEIFGFLYVYPNRLASLGVFVPSWFDNPVRTTYRYLQHWMLHPYLWKHLRGGTLRSWGAKTIQESGLKGEPFLVGNGYARIGEGSGSTNVLTNSGVDEAWGTGIMLAESVLELLAENLPFTQENLEKTYGAKRRKSPLQRELRIAQHARCGFQRGFVRGFIGMGLSGLTRGWLNLPDEIRPPFEHIPSITEFYQGRIDIEQLEKLRRECAATNTPLHDAIMDRLGWPTIPYDGKLLMSHQDALLVGGKVQAPGGYADHVVFAYPNLCEQCDAKVCIELCSGQAITPGDGGVPQFDREKCVHCGACLWNCAKPRQAGAELGNIDFRAGAGGLHSAEN